MTIASLMQVFPLFLAPAVVDMARRQRFKWLDGILLVWLAVVGAAVLWTVVLGLAMGEPLSREMVARGILCGLVAAVERTLRTGKGRTLLPAVDPPNPDAVPLVPSLPAVPDGPPTPVVTDPPQPDLDFSKDPKPSVTS